MTAKLLGGLYHRLQLPSALGRLVCQGHYVKVVPAPVGLASSGGLQVQNPFPFTLELAVFLTLTLILSRTMMLPAVIDVCLQLSSGCWHLYGPGAQLQVGALEGQIYLLLLATRLVRAL